MELERKTDANRQCERRVSSHFLLETQTVETMSGDEQPEGLRRSPTRFVCTSILNAHTLTD